MIFHRNFLLYVLLTPRQDDLRRQRGVQIRLLSRHRSGSEGRTAGSSTPAIGGGMGKKQEFSGEMMVQTARIE